MAALVDDSHSQRGTKEVNSEHSSRGSSSMNNSCCKLIQEATTTRKQPGSPPKRTQLEALVSVPPLEYASLSFC